MAFFKNIKADLGSIVAGSQHTIDYFYDSLVRSDIVSANAGCGCSTPTIEENSIRVVYNSSGHSGDIRKVITINLDESKFPGFNENYTPKSQIQLEFVAKIKS